MSYEERTGIRSLLYSAWHRVESTRLLIGRVAASKLHMIDIDSCEYCCYCREPVALIELQCSTSPPKPAPVMSRLAWMAGVSAWSVSVEPSTSSPPTVALDGQPVDESDVDLLLSVLRHPVSHFRTCTPGQVT